MSWGWYDVQMQNILKRAWTDTLSGLGLSHFSLLRIIIWLAVSITFVILISWWRGRLEAMKEASDIALYVVAFFGVAFALFLWNLWLARYRLLSERIEGINSKSLQATASLRKRPREFNVKHWEDTKTFKLGDAACLWVNVRPHDPIEDDRAQGKFAQLRAAMMSGEIPYTPRGLRMLANLLVGNRLWLEYSHPVSAIALRKYADKTNDVPKFLQSVDVPPEPETGVEAVKELTTEN